MGERGPKGDHGQHGDTGSSGDEGVRGITGERGDRGDRGNPGERGPKGDHGQRGESGASAHTGLRELVAYIVAVAIGCFGLWVGLQAYNTSEDVKESVDANCRVIRALVQQTNTSKRTAALFAPIRATDPEQFDKLLANSVRREAALRQVADDISCPPIAITDK